MKKVTATTVVAFFFGFVARKKQWQQWQLLPSPSSFWFCCSKEGDDSLLPSPSFFWFYCSLESDNSKLSLPSSFLSIVMKKVTLVVAVAFFVLVLLQQRR
jgi:hypothetical protein